MNYPILPNPNLQGMLQLARNTYTSSHRMRQFRLSFMHIPLVTVFPLLT